MTYDQAITVPRLNASDRRDPRLCLRLLADDGCVYYLIEWDPCRKLGLMMTLTHMIPIFAHYQEFRSWKVDEDFQPCSRTEMLKEDY